MKLLRAVVAIALASLLLCVAAVGAAAAGTFTIDDLEEPGVVVAPTGVSTFSGTVTLDKKGGGIFGWVDGRLLTCEDYFGNELNPKGSRACWRVATVEDGLWTFRIDDALLERLEIEFYGQHEVRFALITYNSKGEKVIVAEQSMTVEFVEELPEPVVPDPAPVSPLVPEPESVNVLEPLLASVTVPITQPSALSSLRSASVVIAAPGNLLAAALTTLVLILLTGFPAVLLSQTISENYERITGRFAGTITRLKAMVTLPDLPRWLPIGFGLALATVISAFVEPSFGPNLASIRLLASMGLALFIETILGWWVIRRVLRRLAPELNPRAEFKYGSLVILVVAVLFSRLVGFEPGIVFGLVVGVAFGQSLASAREAQVKLVGIGWALAVGLAGWLGFGVFAGLPGVVPLLLAETLSGVAVSSLAALPVALLPLAALDGEAVFRWNRWIWGAGYAISLLIFFIVLMPMPFSWGEVSVSLAAWLGLYAVFAVVAVGLWAWFRFRSVDAASSDTAAAEAGRAAG